MAGREDSTSMSSNLSVKEEPSDPPTESLQTNEIQLEQQQLGNIVPSSMEVETNAQEESHVVETCTTDNDDCIKKSLSKCVFCAKTIVLGDDPKLLECLHTSCLACIHQAQSGCHSMTDVPTPNNVINCPLCNIPSHPRNLIENRLITMFLEDDSNNVNEDEPKDEDEKKCTNCSVNAIATSWCVDCEDWMCKECVEAHQKLRITKDHIIKPKEDFESVKKKEKKQPLNFFCTTHTREQLAVFCETCDKLTCKDCQLLEHRDHKYKFTDEIAGETKKSVQELLTDITYKRTLLKSAMKIIDERQVLLLDKKKTIYQEITQLVVELTNAINARGKQLIKRLTEVCEQKLSTLSEKKVALEELTKLTDHCMDFTKFTLSNGTDMDVLYNKKFMTNHLQRIKEMKADIPNPDIPVRISLHTDKVSDLIKVVNSIGSIKVDGRVYPSVTPPLESNPQSFSPMTEQKQINSSTFGVPAESPSATQAPTISHTLTQTPNHPINPFTNPPMNITSHQHSMIQAQHMPNPQQIPQQNFTNIIQQPYQVMQPHGLASQNQRMPMYNFNGAHMQQQMMGPRPGLGNQQQVTSSTHPHHQQQQQNIPGTDPNINQNPNLRGLLAHNPPAYRPTVNTAPQFRYLPRYRYPMNNAQRPVIPAQPYQPAGSSLLTNVQLRPPNQSTQQSMLNMYQQHQSQAQSAPWHIPQNMNAALSMIPYASKNSVGQLSNVSVAPVAPANDTYKIVLTKNQSTAAIASQNNNSSTASSPLTSDLTNNTQNMSTISHTVSSSMPKTPSPALHEKSDETQKNLDNISQGSIKELMATIAKLNRNGIMVNNENEKNQLDSSQVDSSTDEGAHAMNENLAEAPNGKDDPNEDWCAVCMDGGDAVLCCDKCPKVFHVYCHIPSLKSFPAESETWQCMLCTNVLEPTEDSGSVSQRSNQMSSRDLRIAQRIVLELYCQYEQSLPFRELVSSEMVDYHKIIKKPIALEVIRSKLNPESENNYSDLKEVFADIRLMFKNAYTFNSTESQVYQEARSLEEYFEKLLIKWAPNHAYDLVGDDDEEVFPPNRKYRRILNE